MGTRRAKDARMIEAERHEDAKKNATSSCSQRGDGLGKKKILIVAFGDDMSNRKKANVAGVRCAVNIFCKKPQEEDRRSVSDPCFCR